MRLNLRVRVMRARYFDARTSQQVTQNCLNAGCSTDLTGVVAVIVSRENVIENSGTNHEHVLTNTNSREAIKRNEAYECFSADC